MSYELIQQLVTTVRANNEVTAIGSGGRQLICRCPFCGDSQKRLSHHFYIKLEPPFWFYCQICSAKGVFSSYVMKHFNVNDPKLMAEMDSTIKTSSYEVRNMSKAVFNTSGLFVEKKTFIPDLVGTGMEQRKFSYLEKRLGVDIDNDFAQKFRLIPSIERFLEANDIDNITCDEDLYMDLYRHYLGFLSYDGKYIVMRDTRPYTKNRYYLYNIFSAKANLTGFYTVKQAISPMTERVRLVMAEGIISTIGGAIHCQDKSDVPTIYASPNGKSFGLIIAHLQRLGFLEIDVEIFSDADMSKWYYKKLMNRIPLLGNGTSFKVHWNDADDDFGVTSDKINQRTITFSGKS